MTPTCPARRGCARIVGALLASSLATACGGGGGSSPPAPPAGALVSLSLDGTVLTTTTASGSGAALTLYPGTRVALATGDAPAAADVVRIVVAAGSAATPALPAGVTPLARVRVAVLVNGAERDASFWLPDAATSTTIAERLARTRGAVLSFATPGGIADRGQLAVLYLATPGGAVRVGGAAVRSGGGALAGGVVRGASAPGGEARFDAGGTGSYGAGTTSAGAAASPPAGAFWSRFTIPAPGCTTVGGVEFCGARVAAVELGEESTTELLALCQFDPSESAGPDSVSSGVHPDGYQFWCQRSQGAPGGVTTVTVSSMQANLPYLNARVVQADGMPFSMVTGVFPDGGLHEAGGGEHADPYTHSEWQFAGFKEIHFTTKADKDVVFALEEGKQPLELAGYSVGSFQFEKTPPRGFHARVQVSHTLDGRVLLEDAVICSDSTWKRKTDRASTRGNKGTYEYAPRMSVGVLPLYVTDLVVANGERNVSGAVMVTRDGEDVTDAQVTVNGVPVPWWTGSLYDVDQAEVSAGPGATIRVEATTADPEQVASVTFQCPPAIEFSYPAPGAVVAATDQLTAQWSPGIFNDEVGALAGGPIVGVFACFANATGDIVNQLGHGDWFEELAAGQTSQAIAWGDCARWVLELQYPGNLVTSGSDGAYDLGLCSVRHRIWAYRP